MSKYIIDSDDVIGYATKYAMLFGDGYMIQPLEDLEELTADYINEHYGDLQDTAYQRGLDDAWGAARKIIRMSDGDILDLFPDCYASVCTAVQAILKYDASEAIAKLKAYEEKQNDKIEVGDEVAFHHDDGRPDTVVVVTYIGQDGFIDGMDGRGIQYAHKNPTKWTKTGRHFDIDKILEEMNE